MSHFGKRLMTANTQPRTSQYHIVEGWPKSDWYKPKLKLSCGRAGNKISQQEMEGRKVKGKKKISMSNRMGSGHHHLISPNDGFQDWRSNLVRHSGHTTMCMLQYLCGPLHILLQIADKFNFMTIQILHRYQILKFPPNTIWEYLRG